jgi:hypothetical protein
MCAVVLWKLSVAGRKEGINARKTETFCHFSLASGFFKFNEETRYAGTQWEMNAAETE